MLITKVDSMGASMYRGEGERAIWPIPGFLNFNYIKCIS